MVPKPNTTIVAIIMISIFSVVFTYADQSDATNISDYVSQLDYNSKSVYDELTYKFQGYEDTLEFNIKYEYPVLFRYVEDAEAYAEITVNDALLAKYFGGSICIWLWDILIDSVDVRCDVDKVSLLGDNYFMVSNVYFNLAVPEKYRDNINTSNNKVQECLDRVENIAQSVSVNGLDIGTKIKSINKFLLNISMEDDDNLSNIYDALYSKSSSSSGIASAFAYLCNINGINALVVKGTVYTNFDDENGSHTGYWNIVEDGDDWYAVDVSMNNKKTSEYLMLGNNSEVTIGENMERFSSTHVADLSMELKVDLIVPTLSDKAYPYIDSTYFLGKYGTPAVIMLITVIIVVSMIYAIKTKNI